MRIDYATNSIVIGEKTDKVFNFISKGAQYDKWHFDYHLRCEHLDIREEAIGSVFSIEELIDGFSLRHVGRVVEYERNRRFVWLGRFALFSWIWIGTDFTFKEVQGGTEVKETLYFIIPVVLLPFSLLFIWRRAFRPKACKAHVLDEISGVKIMLESGDYNADDVVNAFDDEKLLSRAKQYKRVQEKTS